MIRILMLALELDDATAPTDVAALPIDLPGLLQPTLDDFEPLAGMIKSIRVTDPITGVSSVASAF